jgi:hypothetical protein
VASIVVVTAIALVPHRAAAEKVVPLTDGWQIYTDGRAAGFASWAYGDAIPPAISVLDANGNPISISTPQPDGGFRSVTEPPANPADPNAQGKINIMRLRSGFISNVFGFGLRGPVTEWTKFTAYIQFWAFIENDARQKNLINPSMRDRATRRSRVPGVH